MPSTSSVTRRSTSRSGRGAQVPGDAPGPAGDAGAAERGARPAARPAARSGRRRPAHPRADIPVAPDPARSVPWEATGVSADEDLGAAELIAAVSLAVDTVMAQPLETGLA